MELRRKSDDLLLCNHIGEWSGWMPRYNAPELTTVAGVPYIQPIGVAIEIQDITCIFADHYPGATLGKFDTLWKMHRLNRVLRFRDSEDTWHDVRVLAPIGPDSIERWSEVRTKTIQKVKVQLMKTTYIA